MNCPLCSITFTRDNIKVVGAIGEVQEILETFLAEYSGSGILCLNSGSHCVSICFKLFGNPFYYSNKRDAIISAKLLLCELLEKLWKAGWELILSSDLSRRRDHSTMFFRKTRNYYRMEQKIFCLSLDSENKLQLINAPENVVEELLSCADNLALQCLANDQCVQLQLRECLWSGDFLEAEVSSYELLVKCFAGFRQFGYRYYGNTNTKGTTDSLFFISDNEVDEHGDYCIISLSYSNHVRLVNASNQIICVVGRCLEELWTEGVRKAETRNGGNCFEYVLNGTPWKSEDKNVINSRLVATVLLQRVAGAGWNVVTALNTSRRPLNNAFFLLQECLPLAAPTPHVAICPMEHGKLRIINANERVCELIAGTFRRNWNLGINREGRFGRSYELHLAGNPWGSSKCTKSFELSLVTMCRLLHELLLNGWRVICSVDIGAKYEWFGLGMSFPDDAQSWIIAHTEQPHINLSQLLSVPPPFGLTASVSTPSLQLQPSAPPSEEAPPTYEEAMSQSFQEWWLSASS